jgi:hypothetical protein
MEGILKKSGKSLKSVEMSEDACNLEYKGTVSQDVLQLIIKIKKNRGTVHLE